MTESKFPSVSRGKNVAEKVKSRHARAVKFLFWRQSRLYQLAQVWTLLMKTVLLLIWYSTDSVYPMSCSLLMTHSESCSIWSYCRGDVEEVWSLATLWNNECIWVPFSVCCYITDNNPVRGDECSMKTFRMDQRLGNKLSCWLCAAESEASVLVDGVFFSSPQHTDWTVSFR